MEESTVQRQYPTIQSFTRGNKVYLYIEETGHGVCVEKCGYLTHEIKHQPVCTSHEHEEIPEFYPQRTTLFSSLTSTKEPQKPRGGYSGSFVLHIKYMLDHGTININGYSLGNRQEQTATLQLWEYKNQSEHMTECPPEIVQQVATIMKTHFYENTV